MPESKPATIHHSVISLLPLAIFISGIFGYTPVMAAEPARGADVATVNRHDRVIRHNGDPISGTILAIGPRGAVVATPGEKGLEMFIPKSEIKSIERNLPPAEIPENNPSGDDRLSRFRAEAVDGHLTLENLSSASEQEIKKWSVAAAKARAERRKKETKDRPILSQLFEPKPVLRDEDKDNDEELSKEEESRLRKELFGTDYVPEEDKKEEAPSTEDDEW